MVTGPCVVCGMPEGKGGEKHLCSECSWACKTPSNWYCEECLPWIIVDQRSGRRYEIGSRVARYCTLECAESDAEDEMEDGGAVGRDYRAVYDYRAPQIPTGPVS